MTRNTTMGVRSMQLGDHLHPAIGLGVRKTDEYRCP